MDDSLVTGSDLILKLTCESQCWALEVCANIMLGLDLDIIGHPKHPFVVNTDKENASNEDCILFTLFHLSPGLKPFCKLTESGRDYFVKFIESHAELVGHQSSEVPRNNFLNNLVTRLEKPLNSPNTPSLYMMDRNKLIVPQIVGAITSLHDVGSVLSRVLHCLAISQTKARDEIEYALQTESGSISYEVIKNLPYLDQCIIETLRLYPTFIANTNRICNKDIMYGEFTIEARTVIVIPNYAIDHDAQYYSSPYEFIPERFAAKQIAGRHPSMFLPFGNGPRVCPARIIPLILKLGLCHLLRNFKFSPVAETNDPLPLLSSIIALPCR